MLLIGVSLGSADNAYADEEVTVNKAKSADKLMQKMVQYISSVAYCENCGTGDDDPPRWDTPDGVVTARNLTISFLGDLAASESHGDDWTIDEVLDFDYSLELEFDSGVVDTMSGVGYDASGWQRERDE